MRMRPRAASGVAFAVCAVLVLLAIAAGCGKKSRRAPPGPSPELTGLAAVPSTAEVIVGLDAAQLADSPLVTRAIGMLLAREPELAGRWQALRESCKLEIKQVNRVMIALGPSPAGGRFGTGPMVLISTGKIVEADLVKCVREIVGKGGGSLVVQSSQGRTLYQVRDGNRTMFIAFGRPDTVILGNNEAYVHEAVGTGKKALDNPDLAGWLKLVDQDSPVWVVGRVDDRLRAGLVRASNNTLKAGAKAFAGTLDLSTGVQGEVLVLMESAEDAKQLASLLNVNVVGMSWAAQAASLARIVQKISIKAQGDRVQVSAPLTMDDVNRVLSALDGGGAAAQDSPPAGGSAPTPPAP
jgi:hypothetical protein